MEARIQELETKVQELTELVKNNFSIIEQDMKSLAEQDQKNSDRIDAINSKINFLK